MGKIAGISFATSLIIIISITAKDKLKKKKTIQLTFSDIATEFIIVYIASITRISQCTLETRESFQLAGGSIRATCVRYQTEITLSSA